MEIEAGRRSHVPPICGGDCRQALSPPLRPAGAEQGSRLAGEAIADAEQLGGVSLEKLAELFDEERSSQTRVRGRRRAA